MSLFLDEWTFETRGICMYYLFTDQLLFFFIAHKPCFFTLFCQGNFGTRQSLLRRHNCRRVEFAECRTRRTIWWVLLELCLVFVTLGKEPLSLPAHVPWPQTWPAARVHTLWQAVNASRAIYRAPDVQTITLIASLPQLKRALNLPRHGNFF